MPFDMNALLQTMFGFVTGIVQAAAPAASQAAQTAQTAGQAMGAG